VGVFCAQMGLLRSRQEKKIQALTQGWVIP
jgi:hypothetical protein